MFRYTTYGLHIHSELELPELIVDEQAEADVTIQKGSLGHPIPTEAGAITCLQATAEEVYLSWGNTAILLVREGREIVYDSLPGVDERVLRLFILGAGLGVLLHQRRLLVLHASAVAINGQVVAFIGDKGWGKSTTAATLHGRGHYLMTDDLVAIQIIDNKPMVLPGYPQVKLWPNAAEALGTNPDALPQIRDEIEKRARMVTDGFSRTNFPLAAIYVLGGGEQFGIEPLPAQIALLQLIRHLYVSRFGTEYAKSAGGKDMLGRCGELLKHVPVRVLKRQFDLTALDQMAVLIENDVAQLNQGATTGVSVPQA